MEPYKGQLRLFVKTGKITSGDVIKVSEKLCMSKLDAKNLIKQRLFSEPRLQQFNGESWQDIETELHEIVVDVDRYI